MATTKENKKNYRIDFTSMTLIMTADFADKAYKPDTEEYKILRRLQKDFRGLKIERKTHSRPTSYTTSNSKEKFSHNPYKGITYDNMERFIAAVDNNTKNYKAEYDRVREYAQAMGKKRAYAIVAEWFVKQFPKYRTDPFYYYSNRPETIPFCPANIDKCDNPELAPTGTDG